MWRALSAAGMYLLGAGLFAMLYLCLCRADTARIDREQQQQAIERRTRETTRPALESQSTTLARYVQ